MLPYIVDTQPVEYIAESDGTVSDVSSNTLTVQFDNGDPDLVLKGLNKIFVTQGDLVFAGDKLASKPNMKMGVLVKGLLTTLKLSVISLFFAVIIGLIAALMRISSNPLSKNFSLLYVELIRGTPLLVQIFIVYCSSPCSWPLQRVSFFIILLQSLLLSL